MVKEYVKAKAKSTYHPVGPCAMMPREKGGVVDSRLRIGGVKALRVVDATGCDCYADYSQGECAEYGLCGCGEGGGFYQGGS
jgi:hypothetical protein